MRFTHVDVRGKAHFEADPDDLERLRNLLDWAAPAPSYRLAGLQRLAEIRDVIATAQRRMNADPEPDDETLDQEQSAVRPARYAEQIDLWQGAQNEPPPDSLFTGARGISYMLDRAAAWQEYRQELMHRDHLLPPQVD